jgi:hypothetical protein
VYQTAHREQQFEMRDLRRGGANGAQTFGFPSDNIRLSRFARGEFFLVDRTAVDAETHSGDIGHSTFFACGDPEGRVHIWDLRNVREPLTQVSSKSPTTLAQGFFTCPQVKCFHTKINNVIWHESHLLASSPANNIAAIHYAYPANSNIPETI